MRSFPGARRRLLPALAVVACLGLVSTTATLATPSSRAFGDDGGSGPHLKDRQDAVHSQVQQAEQDADDASAEVSSASQAVTRASAALGQAYDALTAARDHVEVVGGQLASAQTVATQAQAALTRAQSLSATAQAASATAQAASAAALAALQQAQAAVVTGRQQLEAQRVVVQQTVVGLYQSGSPDLLTLSGYLDSSSPSDLTRRLEYSQTVVEDQTSAFEGLHDAEVALLGQQRQADAAAQQAATAAQQADAAAQEAGQAEQVVADAQADAAGKLGVAQTLSDEAVVAADDASRAKVSVAATLQRRQQAELDAKAARKADLAKLAELKQQEAHIKQLVLAAAAKDTGQGFVGASTGFLLSPIAGAELTSPFGYRIHPIYHYWGLHDGTDFAAPCGTPMQASADGTVIAASWSDIYGNRLYIDVGKVNGQAITVNYNHAERYVVGVGDHVTRGQTVGYEGTTGWSTGCHTHFTVLQDGTPVDPMSYINGNG